MSLQKIADAAKWTNSRCKDDLRCIAQHGHPGPHRDLTKTWPREDEEEE